MKHRKFRHKVVFTLLRPFFRLFFKLKYNTVVFNYKLNKEPYLILSNHLTILDPFLVGLAFGRPIYYMASEDLSSSKYGKLITWLVNPIYKAKSKSDLGAVKECIRVVKEGGTICIFPEGNRSYDGRLCKIEESIAKMVKMLKVPVVLFNIKGGYGTDPRWAKKARRGKSYGRVKRILSAEEIKEMSVDELYQIIIKELTVPQVPTTLSYKSKASAEGLDRILYICPKCGKLHQIYTEGDFIYCKACGLKVSYTEHLNFETDDKAFKFKYVSDWYQYQKDYVKTFNLDKEFTYIDEGVTLYTVEKGSVRKEVTSGQMLMNNKIISVGEISFNLSEVENMTVLGKHKINMYINGLTYQFIGDDNLNVVKYLHMYTHLYNKEETV